MRGPACFWSPPSVPRTVCSFLSALHHIVSPGSTGRWSGLFVLCPQGQHKASHGGFVCTVHMREGRNEGSIIQRAGLSYREEENLGFVVWLAHLTPGEGVTQSSVSLSVYTGQTDRLCNLFGWHCYLRNPENRGTLISLEGRQIKDGASLASPWSLYISFWIQQELDRTSFSCAQGSEAHAPTGGRPCLLTGPRDSEALHQQVGLLTVNLSTQLITFPEKLHP